jgi:hypothetical protein
MTKAMSRIGLVLAMLVGASGWAKAELLVDQGPPDYQTSYYSTFNTGVTQSLADHFSLGSAATLGSTTFWGGYYPGNTPLVDDFTLYVYANSAGKPGTVIMQESIATTRTDTGHTFASTGIEAYQYTATLAPISLDAGSYWLSIVNTAGSASDSWSWATYNESSTDAVTNHSPTTGPWIIALSGDQAFQLSSPAAVPEPSSLAMCGLAGIVGLGVARLRRKRS